MRLLLSDFVVPYINVILISTPISFKNFQEFSKILKSVLVPIPYWSLDIEDSCREIGYDKYKLMENMEKIKLILTKTV